MQTASEVGAAIPVPATREIFWKIFCSSNDILRAELEVVTDQLSSFAFFLPLTARLSELCYNQLCLFGHVEIGSKGLKSCKRSRGWLRAQNSGGAQRAGVRCADASPGNIGDSSLFPCL